MTWRGFSFHPRHSIQLGFQRILLAMMMVMVRLWGRKACYIFQGIFTRILTIEIFNTIEKEMHMQSIFSRLKRERERYNSIWVLECHIKRTLKCLNISWKNPNLTFLQIQSRLEITPEALVREPQNSQIVQMWHTLHPFTDSAIRIPSRKYGAHKGLWAAMRAEAALFWGSLSFPPRKTQECGYSLSPFSESLGSTYFIFLKCKPLCDRAQSVHLNWAPIVPSLRP